MKAERWKQIDGIFQAALDRGQAERAAFLDEACKGDRSLRREVEALIDSHDKAGSFIEAPVFEAAAELVINGESESLIGRELGAYKITEVLGVGGMGEVYLAQDRRLGRRVALKLLPAFYTRDPDRLRRFEMEARSASALNHPNILTIFDVGEIDGIHFIATEYVEGETLRSLMRRRSSSLVEVLDACAQASSALAAAHAAGIVHRDIKPENIMLRPDRYVKVLDFGLAKLTESRTPASETALTVMKLQTDPGTIVGTAYYMSPEQARGHPVDGRTDIFSLGVVLYEMVTGHLPFQGETTSDVIASILKTEPEQLERYVERVPAELQRIVSKALRKDREERYQSVRDFMVDLRSLKQELEIESKLRPSAHSTAGDARGAGTQGRQAAARTGGTPALDTAGSPAPRTTSSAEIILSEIKRHKTGAAIALLTVILLIGAVGYGLYRFVGQDKLAAPFQTMNVARLTTTGRVTEAAISPDGKYVAFVMNDAAGQNIWMRQVATSSSVLIAPASGAQYNGLIFSPDGNYVYYVKQEEGLPDSTLYQMPVLGGAPKKITERVHGGLTFSPDGKQIAFARWRPGRGEGPRSEKLLLVMNSDGSSERKITSRWTPEIIYDSAWSPDGRVIAFTVQNFQDGSFSIVEAPTSGGAEKPIKSQKWFNVGRIAWLPDGNGLLVPGSDKASSQPQIWHLAYPSGEARRITNDLNGYNNISLTADSKALVTVQSDQVSNIWVAPGGDAVRAKQITSGGGRYGAGVFVHNPTGAGRADNGGGVCWTPDGRIVYHSLASGRLDLWIMNPDGTAQKQLTSDAGSNVNPSVSPDGRYIVFGSDRAGRSDIWRIDPDGNNPTQVNFDGGWFPSCSADGKWVIFQLESGGNHLLWKTPIEGGVPVQVTSANDVVQRPSVSPDGKLIACNFIPPGSDWQLRIAALSFEDGKPAHVFDTMTINAWRELRWTADGRYLTYIDTHQGVSNLWGQPLAGGTPVQLTNFKSDLMFSWDWSRDGRLACARGAQTSDVVLISDFR
ncbi:MAG TPA: protein kinase [Blastocatellia bacterium]|nr:protein kinase [Blastocatellia bacterium]